MKISSGKRKAAWLLLVLTLASQSAVSCTRDSDSEVQALVEEQEKILATESETEEEPVIFVQKDDWMKDGTDVAAVNKDTEIEYADGDCERSVTRDICFVNRTPYAMNTSWFSSDESVITDGGKVKRQQEDKTVTITATVSYHGKKYRKDFTLTVKRKNTIDVTSLEDYSLDQLAVMNRGENDYEVEVNDSGYISHICGKYSEIKVDSWDTAMTSLYNIKSLLGIGSISEELRLTGSDVNGAAYKYEFTQFYKGMEVWRGKISMISNRGGRTLELNSSYFPISGDTDTSPKITKEEAVERMEQEGYKGFPDLMLGENGTEQFIYNENGKGRSVWRLFGEDGQRDVYEILVDTKTGETVRVAEPYPPVFY